MLSLKTTYILMNILYNLKGLFWHDETSKYFSDICVSVDNLCANFQDFFFSYSVFFLQNTHFCCDRCSLKSCSQKSIFNLILSILFCYPLQGFLFLVLICFFFGKIFKFYVLVSYNNTYKSNKYADKLYNICVSYWVESTKQRVEHGNTGWHDYWNCWIQIKYDAQRCA
jgi:hypothetical protein